MYAVEFETTVENKRVAIPQQYNLDNQKVRVIILTDAPMVKPANKLIDIIASAMSK